MDPRDIRPHWLDEEDWLCTVEYLSSDNAETRAWDAKDLGYLLGYAMLTDTRTLALVGDAVAEAYEILFSFASPEHKQCFLDLVRSNEEMGSCYVENEFAVPTFEEIKNARPLASVVPHDIVRHATLIARTLVAGTGHDRLG